MSIADIMARHRPILPQRGTALGGLGFSLKRAFKTVTKPIVAVHNIATKAVTAPLKISSKIVGKLPGGSGISKALLKGASNVTTTSMMSQNLLAPRPSAPGSTAFQAPTAAVSVEPPSPFTGPPSGWNGMPPGNTMQVGTPQPGSGSIYSPAMPSGSIVDSSGAPMAQPMTSQDAGPVLAPWYEQPLYLGGAAVAAFVGWKLYQRMKRRR